MKNNLADQIWFTRVSRAKAEKRLIDKENFAKFINVYYSLFAIMCSIISFLYDDKKMSLFTIIITIGVMISILSLNRQRYSEQAIEFRNNYTELQKLEFRALNPNNEIEEIQDDYCKLLNSAGNHIEYDYLKAIEDSSDEYKKMKDWDNKKGRLRWEKAWRFFVKLLLIIAPILILIMCEAWA